MIFLVTEAWSIHKAVHSGGIIGLPLPIFVFSSFYTALGWWDTVKHLSLADLFKFVLNRFDSEEELPEAEAGHFWSNIISEGS